MDYLQYSNIIWYLPKSGVSFKPYYKWITFNILIKGIDIVFIIERINFYMVAKFNHFSTPQRFLFFYIKILV